MKLFKLERTFKFSVTDISNLFSTTDVFIQKTQTKIKANEEREFILNKKSQMLETKIQETEEILTIVGNITPVEIEENCNTKQITVLFFYINF